MSELKNPENPVVARIYFELDNAQRHDLDPIQEMMEKQKYGTYLEREDVLRIVQSYLKDSGKEETEQWGELAQKDRRLQRSRDSLERLAVKLMEENSRLLGDLDRHAANCECPDKGEWW